MEWRLSSPSATELSCQIGETPDGFVLRVTRKGEVLFISHADDPEPLRALASAWCQSLESRGYVPVPGDAPPPDS